MWTQGFSLRRQGASPAGGAGARTAAVLVAALLWFLAAMWATHVVLRLGWRDPFTPLEALPTAPVSASVAQVARALGATADADAASMPAGSAVARWRLLGVVGTAGERGTALIAVDGRAPRPVAVGAVVDGDLVLQSVGPRVARLGTDLRGPVVHELRLPERP
jgi:general secretion pathway protein C